MATTSSSVPADRLAGHPAERSVWAAVVAAVLLTAVPAGPGRADDTDRPDAVEEPRAKLPSLPAAPNRVGRIRRDADGKIVPDGPPLPPDENATRPIRPTYSPPPPTLVPSPSTPGAPAPYDTTYLESLQNRQAHARRAREEQARIDRILREEAAARARGAPVDGHGLTARERTLARELARTDEDVRQREMRRYTIGQPYAGHPQFWFVTGPRGKRYAVAGFTPLDASIIDGNPAATLRKLEILRRAALAPMAPSREDYLIVRELERLINVLRERL